MRWTGDHILHFVLMTPAPPFPSEINPLQHTMSLFHILAILSLLGLLDLAAAGTKSKPHGHPSVLERFDGKHIPYSISAEQEAKLLAGHPVVTKYYVLVY
jgi:hypothetical protein